MVVVVRQTYHALEQAIWLRTKGVLACQSRRKKVRTLLLQVFMSAYSHFFESYSKARRALGAPGPRAW